MLSFLLRSERLIEAAVHDARHSPASIFIAGCRGANLWFARYRKSETCATGLCDTPLHRYCVFAAGEGGAAAQSLDIGGEHLAVTLRQVGIEGGFERFKRKDG